jgi:hypothetical protein
MPRSKTPPIAAMTTREAAAHVGLAAGTLAKARIYGGGPPWVVLLKGAVRYRVVDLDEWMAARVTGRQAPPLESTPRSRPKKT